MNTHTIEVNEVGSMTRASGLLTPHPGPLPIEGRGGNFGRVMALVMAALFLFAGGTSMAAEKKLNVLFIAADDLRNDLGCYGDKQAKTPNLDKLAKRGVMFNRAYCQQAVCNPSRASLLTGMRPDTLRIWDLPTHFRDTTPDAVTLPQHFKNNGYFTQNIGKIFHNWLHTIQGDPVSWSVPAEMHFNNHGKDTPVVEGKVPPNLAKDPKCMMIDVPDEAYFDGRIAAKAVTALQDIQQKGQPFFLAVGFWKPHSPFNAPKKYWDLYKREDITMPENPYWPKDTDRVAWHNSREILTDKQRPLTPEAVREIRHGYLAAISYLDAQVGKVIDELDKLGLGDNTVIVFWSDHGYHLGEHTLWAKTSNFELDARVPLLIASPKSKSKGKTADGLVELLDLYPTLVDLCGLPRVKELEGMSLVPILNDPKAKVKPIAITQHPRPAYYKEQPDFMGYSARNERWRYTEWRDWKTGKIVARELYDHDKDPLETVNVVEDKKNKDTVDTLAKLLQPAIKMPALR